MLETDVAVPLVRGWMVEGAFFPNTRASRHVGNVLAQSLRVEFFEK
jgi:hypothetical protein